MRLALRFFALPAVVLSCSAANADSKAPVSCIWFHWPEPESRAFLLPSLFLGLSRYRHHNSISLIVPMILAESLSPVSHRPSLCLKGGKNKLTGLFLVWFSYLSQ